MGIAFWAHVLRPTHAPTFLRFRPAQSDELVPSLLDPTTPTLPDMLSRAVLPLTRPNVLASTARVSGLTAHRARYFSQGPVYNAQKLPKDLKAKSNKPKTAEQPEQSQYAKEQPEFDTKAKPETDASESAPVSYTPYHPIYRDHLSNNH